MRTRWLLLPVLTAALSVAPATAAAVPASEAPWLSPAFEAAPAAVAEAARRATADEPAAIAVLVSDVAHSFDTEGRRTYHRRLVYRINAAEGLDGWSRVESEWSPSLEERPLLVARVITPRGEEYRLDPATISEGPASTVSNQIFDDRRTVEAPLPGLSVGAVVEEVVTVREHRPFYRAGVTIQEVLVKWAPVYRGRVSVMAPAATPLRYRLQLLDGARVAETEADGQRRITLDYANLPAFDGVEPGLPPDRPRVPAFFFSTGESWAAIAESYSELVEARIAETPAGPLLAAATRGRRQGGVDDLLAWVRREVRYTGLELGTAGIVPVTPAETVRRKFGDCKDQATLLAALLRGRGVEAHVALVQTGPGQDVPATLPGLGQFDHAIVHLPGPPARWIDPTSTHTRAGELALGLQGRLALIAAPGTTELVRLPASGSGDNLVVERRHMLLADFGPGRVVETTEYRGSLEQEMREVYAGSDPAAIRTQLEEYTIESYLVERVARARHSDPVDLATPFRIELVGEAAARASADLTEAAVGIELSSLFLNLPDELFEEDAPRRQPYAFTQPHRAEIRYRIEPPLGMALVGLPETAERLMGGARFALAARETTDGAVELDLLFDTGPRVKSPRQFEELREGVTELADREVFLVRFEHEAQAHLAAGRLREAIAQHRRLLAAEPRKAIHRVRFVQTLLAAGLQPAAVREARRAVELEPSSATARWVLGWALQHDELGRRFGDGFDYAGAVAALRRAKELDPGSQLARAELAILLEHNAHGIHFGEGADLEAAVAEHLSFREDFGNDGLDANIMQGLLYSGRFAELEEFTESLSSPDSGSLHRLLAITLNRGPREAITAAGRTIKDAEDRLSSLSVVSQELVKLGHYRLAAALLQELARFGDNPGAILARARMLEQFRRLEEIEPDRRQPEGVVTEFIRLVASEDFGYETARGLFHPGLFEVPGLEPETVDAYLRDGMKDDDPASATLVDQQGMSRKVLAELMLGALDLTAEGDDAIGYRVRVEGRMGASQQISNVFVAAHGKEYRLVASEDVIAGLALEALRSLARGEPEVARRWLDWAAEEYPELGIEDPLIERVFPRLWRALEGADAAAMRVAAATLLVEEGLTEAGVPILAERLAARPAGDEALLLRIAMLDAHMNERRFAEAHELAREVLAATGSKAAFGAAVDSLLALERFEEAEAAISKRLALAPDDRAALRAQGRLAAGRMDLDLHFATCQKLQELDAANGSTYNGWAWMHLFREPLAAEAVELAERAAQLTDYERWDVLHTLASVYASAGHPEAAYKTIVKGVDLKPDKTPGEADWYVLGRIAEEYGLDDDARAYYRRVGDDEEDGPTTAALATRRLASLGKR